MNLTCKSFESEKNRVCSLCTMPKSHLCFFFIDNRSLESESSTGPSRWRQVQRAAGHYVVIYYIYAIWIVIPDRPVISWNPDKTWHFGNRELQTATNSYTGITVCCKVGSWAVLHDGSKTKALRKSALQLSHTFISIRSCSYKILPKWLCTFFSQIPSSHISLTVSW